jgi:hypothetical protein
MSMLPTGRPLERFIPDVDEFFLDPAAYLKAGTVEIGPRKAYRLAALFGAFGIAFLVACAVSGAWRDERFLLGIGLLIGAVVWLAWSLRMHGHSLLLRPDGVEVRYRDTVVWCPWALFNTTGHPIIPEGDSPQVAIILPVVEEAVPFVELRRNETPVAYGSQIKVPQFRFSGADQVILSARYEMAANDLGALLLRLGGRLGRSLPRGAPPPEAYRTSTDAVAADITGPDGAGWYTVSLGRLHFPPRCCNCGQATDSTMSLPIFGQDFAGRLAGTALPAELSIPYCPDCRTHLREAYQRRGLRGLNFGVVAGMLAAVGLVFARGEREAIALAFTGLAGAAVGGLAGFLVAGAAGREALPIRFRRYQPASGMLQVRFRDPHYADIVLAASSRKHSTG